MKQKIVRKTLTGNWEKFEFDVYSNKFFIKNFSSGNILASFADDEDEDGAFKILPNIGEEIYYSEDTSVRFNRLWIKGTGEVEVQATSF